MARIELVDRNGNLTGETAEREKAYAPSFQGIKPHSHALIFSKQGGLYTQIRAKSKKAWPEKEILFLGGGNANPNREGDFIENGQGRRIDYKTVASNELREEIGITIPARELTRIQRSLPNVVCFQELGTIYLAAHFGIYDKEHHGEFNVNSNEVNDWIHTSASKLDRLESISRNFGEYGEKLFTKVKELSEEIRNSKA